MMRRPSRARTFLVTLSLLTACERSRTASSHSQTQIGRPLGVDAGKTADCTFEGDRRCQRLGAQAELDHRFADAIVFARRGCELGDPSCCTSLGDLFTEGKAGAPDFKSGAEAFQKGCDLDDSISCRRLAVLHRKGRGVDLNVNTAKELEQKAKHLEQLNEPEADE